MGRSRLQRAWALSSSNSAMARAAAKSATITARGFSSRCLRLLRRSTAAEFLASTAR